MTLLDRTEGRLEPITSDQLHADPNAIRTLVALRDAARIQAAIRDGFGFEATPEYCAALVAHVDAVEAHMKTLEARISDLERQLATKMALVMTPEDFEAMLHGY